jgi:peptide deformylase
MIFRWIICGVLAMFLSNDQCFSDEVKIVTVDSPLNYVLKEQTEDILEDELPLAQEIAEKLFLALKPHLPAAGLAAPQIGISKSIFIYSYDRDPNHLEVVINPSFIPVDNTQVVGWEACFSVILSEGTWKIASVPRYQTIKVEYLTLQGERIEKMLDGFAAKVFQHEYDHLQGIENIDREDAVVKTFESKEELVNYMLQVKKEDSQYYNRPHSS